MTIIEVAQKLNEKPRSTFKRGPHISVTETIDGVIKRYQGHKMLFTSEDLLSDKWEEVK